MRFGSGAVPAELLEFVQATRTIAATTCVANTSALHDGCNNDPRSSGTQIDRIVLDFPMHQQIRFRGIPVAGIVKFFPVGFFVVMVASSCGRPTAGSKSINSPAMTCDGIPEARPTWARTFSGSRAFAPMRWQSSGFRALPCGESRKRTEG